MESEEEKDEEKRGHKVYREIKMEERKKESNENVKRKRQRDRRE